MSLKKIGFIGVGKMATAIIRGLITKGVSPSCIYVSDIAQQQIEAAKKLNVNVLSNNRLVAQNSDSVIVAVKPNTFSHVLNEIKDDVGTLKTVVSIAGGLTLSTLEKDLHDGARVVRVMPNVCSEVLQSVSAVVGGTHSTQSDVDQVMSIFNCVGISLSIDEKLFDAFSAVAGCGPAFIFPVIEALADGGVLEGLDRSTAYKLAAQMVMGSAKLVLESGKHPGELKDSVCSPGGSTIVGVKALEDGNVRASFINAVIQSCEKSKAMGRPVSCSLK